MRDFSITRFYFLSLVLLAICSCKIQQSALPFTPASSHAAFPQPIGYVNDFENILSKKEEKAIRQLLEDHAKKTSDQIAVITITSINPYDNLKDYTTDLAGYWRLGQRKYNGVLIALSKDLRQVRISNGSGIVQRLTNEETQKIIDERMIPEFKDNQYYQGLRQGIEAIIRELE